MACAAPEDLGQDVLYGAENYYFQLVASGQPTPPTTATGIPVAPVATTSGIPPVAPPPATTTGLVPPPIAPVATTGPFAGPVAPAGAPQQESADGEVPSESIPLDQWIEQQ